MTLSWTSVYSFGYKVKHLHLLTKKRKTSKKNKKKQGAVLIVPEK